MDKYKKRGSIAIMMVCLLASCMCLSGCNIDLFGINDDEGGINVTEKLNIPNSHDSIPDDTGIENPDDPDDPTIKNYDNGIMYPEEAEGAEVKLKTAEGGDFVGSWEAKSGNAHYLFGNMNIRIQDSRIWSGNITEEDVRGTWSEKNGGIYLKSDFIEAQLNFTASNKLLLRYKPFEDSEGYVSVILTKA